MPVLKRFKVPLYYMNKRGKHICFNMIDTTLYIKPEQYDIVDAMILGEDEKKEKKKQTKKTKSSTMSKFKVTFSSPVTESVKDTILEVLDQSFRSSKVLSFFRRFMETNIKQKESSPESDLDTLRDIDSTSLLTFRHYKRKAMNSVVIGIKPHPDIPKKYVLSDTLIGFLYNVLMIELNDIVDIKSIKAEYTK